MKKRDFCKMCVVDNSEKKSQHWKSDDGWRSCDAFCCKPCVLHWASMCVATELLDNASGHEDVAFYIRPRCVCRRPTPGRCKRSYKRSVLRCVSICVAGQLLGDQSARLHVKFYHGSRFVLQANFRTMNWSYKRCVSHSVLMCVATQLPDNASDR